MEPDVRELITRLDRMWQAVDLGCAVVAGQDRPLVAGALRDTVWEAVDVAHRLTQVVAYDDLWTALDALIDRWRQVESAALQVQVFDPEVCSAADLALEMRRHLQAIRDAVEIIDAEQVAVVARPRDREAVARLTEAIGDLESHADRTFMDAVCTDVDGRVDAAMAVLTTCTARATRERNSLRSRASD